MKKFGLLSTSAMSSAAIFGMAVAFAAPAYAQDAPPECTPEQQSAGDCVPSAQPAAPAQAIVVTGSRIRRPNLDSPVPITSVTPDELPNQGQASIGDALNDLPSLRSTFGQQNSGRFIGTAGNNFLDLRGLGISRTLVLVNGRRHITSSVGDFIPDVNTIPQDLLQRVDIVTGGESAVYGSDAIAGVVNFILRQDYDGLRIHAQDGISSRGDRGVQVLTLTAGRNFAENRANISISLEYTNADPLYFGDRPGLSGAFAGRCQFQLSQDTIGEPQAGDGIADNVFTCGVRNAGISDGGTIGILSSDGTALRFAPNGNLFFDTPDASFLPFGSGNVQGGTGSTLRNTGQLAVGQDRYIANLLAHYDVADALQFFVEGKYVYQRVVQEGQPSFFQGAFSNFFGIPNLRCDNGFLNNQALTTLQSFGICSNVATGTFNVARFNVDFGGRSEIDKRYTYRIVGGIRGDFNDDWHYELSLNYGHFRSRNVETNNLQLFDINGNLDAFSLAIDSVRNGAGQVVCRVNADADPTNDRPDCVPINIFGGGAPSQAALDFVNTTSTVFSRASELDILGYVSGDFSQLFELPGGPIGFSIGGEYRRETAFQEADPLSASGATFFNAFSRFDPPAFKVAELFGEFRVPLLRDLPFAHELTVSGAARYSDYNTSANHTSAWNINGVWAPVSDIRFRANYSRSVRVPTLNDLFGAPGQNFAFIADPCDSANINNGGPDRPVNCAALGVPTTANQAVEDACAGTGFPTPVGDPWRNCLARSSSTGFTSGGNPNLSEEVGKSFTVGGVFTPRFVPGFSLSVDYFDIKVDNLIAVLGAQTILNQCVDLSDLNNQFCAATFPRDPATGFFNNPAVLSAGINFATQTSRGIDFDLSYRHTFSNGVRLNLRGLGTYTLERLNFTDPTDPTRADRALSELGDPVFSGALLIGLGYHAWDLQWSVRYIGRQTISTYEATHEFQGRAPTNPDVTGNLIYYPDVFYHDVRLNYQLNNRFNFYLGVDNLFDRDPPLDLLGTEGGSPFSSIGRFFYGGVTVDF